MVSLIYKVVRSLYTNTGLFEEHFKDYHFLILRTQIVVAKSKVEK